MLDLIPVFLAALFRNRADTSLEILALRQQVAVLKRKRPRPSLNGLDRFFWTSMSVAESCTSTSLVIRPPSGLSKQLREAFPEAAPYRYAILDHDAKFSRCDRLPKWELISLRSAALILLVIATVQLIAPEIMKLSRQIIEWFP